ncbi:lysylphosphatidylglycerol synthase domain-containing protein [Mesorhizobium sp. BR1-1-16]|nr:lysylphosphatidylglycerol synthase domain-containing protein [Mesorhizobium sp. BR1-1-16]
MTSTGFPTIDDHKSTAAHPGRATTLWRRWKPWLGRGFWLVGLCLAGVLIWLALRQYSLSEIGRAITAVPTTSILLALGFAAASYTCLTLSDVISLRYVGHRLPYRAVALASFVSLSIGHSVGLSGLSSGAIRYRFYRRRGVHLAELARLTLMCGMTVLLGLVALAIAPLASRPELTTRLLGSAGLGYGLASVGLALVLGYWLLAWRRTGPLKVWRWQVEVPSIGMAVGQTAVGAVNFALVSACLYALVRTAGPISYLDLVAIFVIANVATLVSHVPGGVGVIESIVILLLPGEAVVGPVLLFRFVYFLLPLVIGCVMLAGSEWHARRRGAADRDGSAAASPARTAPRDRESASRPRNAPGRALPETP